MGPGRRPLLPRTVRCRGWRSCRDKCVWRLLSGVHPEVLTSGIMSCAEILLGGSLVGMSDIPRANSVGRRVVVTGLAGAGKSTFSRALSARTGLPVIVLDFHFWLPGWAEPTEAAWREKQKGLLAGDAWIADGNYHATLDLRLERADTVVFLDIRWWICAWRALVRGIRTRPADFELPDGCDES